MAGTRMLQHRKTPAYRRLLVGVARVMGLREGGPLLVETARLLHDGCGVAEQDRIAGQAEDEIAQAPMGEHLEHLRGGEMAVPTDQDMGLGPGATQRGQEPDQDHRVLRAGGARARAEAGRHQGPESPAKINRGT